MNDANFGYGPLSSRTWIDAGSIQGKGRPQHIVSRPPVVQ